MLFRSGGNPYLIVRRVANPGGPRVEGPRCQGSLGSRGSRRQGFPCPRAPAAGLRTSAAEWRRGASASRGLFARPGWRSHRGIAPLGREPPDSAAAAGLGQFCGAAVVVGVGGRGLLASAGSGRQVAPSSRPSTLQNRGSGGPTGRTGRARSVGGRELPAAGSV